MGRGATDLSPIKCKGPGLQLHQQITDTVAFSLANENS